MSWAATSWLCGQLFPLILGNARSGSVSKIIKPFAFTPPSGMTISDPLCSAGQKPYFQLRCSYGSFILSLTWTSRGNLEHMVYSVPEMDCNCTDGAAKELCSMDGGVWRRVVPLQLWKKYFSILSKHRPVAQLVPVDGEGRKDSRLLSQTYTTSKHLLPLELK